MSDWYTVDAKGPHGPYSLNDLRTMLRDGDLSPDEQVQHGRDGLPIAAGDVPELSSVSSTSPRRVKAPASGGGSNATIWVIVIALLALVLVGGGIVAMVAMLLPAVQEVRVAARRAQSQDHLHNIVIGLHNYEGAHKSFPPGGIVEADGTEWHGWATYLLPYVEQQPLYMAMDVENKTWDDPALQPLISSQIDLYLNPAIPELRDARGRAVSHYSANEHLLFENSAVQFADITDGTSNVLLVGEISADFPPWASPRNYRDPQNGIGAAAGKFGGPDGAQFGLADGKVEFIDASIDPDVLLRLALPADGEPVAVP